VKTKKYGWVVLLTSGYNNSDGKGYLYVVNPKTGALLEKMQTPTSANGLAHASAYVADFADNTADAVYAADLDGQLWRFDLTATKGSTSAYPTPTKLATLADASGNAQPVTTAPLIEINPVTRKRFVLLGTGKLLDSSDVNSKAAQSFYALIDGTAGAFNTVSTAITRANLTQVTDVTTGTTLASTSAGWYIDLGIDTSVSWRMVSSPVAYNGVVAFSSLLTTGDACSPSGQSRVYAINYGTGKSVLVPASSGYVSVASAVTDLRFVSVDGSPQLIAGTTKGDITKIPTDLKSGITLRLLNWREVPAVN
jgi:type IV pilus assembly protein PilY1